MTKQNRDFVPSIRPTFTFDDPSFVGAPKIGRRSSTTYDAPVSQEFNASRTTYEVTESAGVPRQVQSSQLLVRAPLGTRLQTKPLPKIGESSAKTAQKTASHLALLAWQIENALLPVAKLHAALQDTLKWVIYYDTITDINDARKLERLAASKTLLDEFAPGPPDRILYRGKPEQFVSNEAKLKALMAQRPAVEASAAAKATGLAKQMATYMSVYGAPVASAQSLVTDIKNAVEQFDKQVGVPCPASYVRDPKLGGPAYSVPCIFNTSGQVALEQAILRSRDLQSLASKQYGAKSMPALEWYGTYGGSFGQVSGGEHTDIDNTENQNIMTRQPKQNRDFVVSTRPTFTFDEPAFVGAPQLVRAPVGTRLQPLPKIKHKNQLAWESWTGRTDASTSTVIGCLLGGRLGTGLVKSKKCSSGFAMVLVGAGGASSGSTVGDCFIIVDGMAFTLIVPPALWHLDGIQSWGQARRGYVVQGGKLVGLLAELSGGGDGFGVSGVEPATLSCPPGEALYMGRCVPRVRVPAGAALGGGRPALYVVAAGDTTSGIAEKLGVTVPALLAANHGRPVVQLRSGHWVFATLTEREKINVPRGSVGLAGTPGALSAGPGEACGYTDWCDSGYHCENGVCVADFVPAQAGLSNTGSYCDAGGGPQSGYVGADNACIPIGGNTAVGAEGSNSLIGNVVCPGPNMHPDWNNITAWECICDEGYINDPKGPGCVPGEAQQGSGGAYISADECKKAGGQIDPQTGACGPKGGGTSFGGSSGAGKAGGGGTAGGGKATPTGGTKTTIEPVDTKTGLIGSLSPGMMTALKVGAGVLAVGAVGGGAYAYAKHRKNMKDKGGKAAAGSSSPKALPPKKK